ncbi:MAG: guanylate kinase [Verrucomicrobia bacterium]|nr:guanylate kinase [Verrucomicrobiota bacterium]
MNLPSLSLSNTRRSGILFLISAPSGAGKSTLLQGLRLFGDFSYSVSCTTRQPRPGERNGADYHFLSRAEFELEIQRENFLEWAQVHGHYYGTPKDAVKEKLANGIDVLVDVDVQGARSIRANNDALIQNALTSIFLAPTSMEELTRRLTKRGTESEEQMQLRLRNAALEMECWRDYDYLLVSGSAAEDQARFRCIMETERLKCKRIAAEGGAL